MNRSMQWDLHVYELLKLLAAVLRQTHAHPVVNSYISPEEIHTLFEPVKRNQLLKTEIRLRKQNKKSINVRVRILCKVFVKYDISVLKNILLLDKKPLEKTISIVLEMCTCMRILNYSLSFIFW